MDPGFLSTPCNQVINKPIDSNLFMNLFPKIEKKDL